MRQKMRWFDYTTGGDKAKKKDNHFAYNVHTSLVQKWWRFCLCGWIIWGLSHIVAHIQIVLPLIDTSKLKNPMKKYDCPLDYIHKISNQSKTPFLVYCCFKYRKQDIAVTFLSSQLKTISICRWWRRHSICMCAARIGSLTMIQHY